MIFRKHIWLSLLGSELEAGAESRNVGCSGQLLQMLWFGFSQWWLQKLWVRDLLSRMAWPFSICIFSLKVKENICVAVL